MEAKGIILCVLICFFVGFSEGLGYYGYSNPLGMWKTYKTCYSAPSYPCLYGGGCGLGCYRPCLKSKIYKNYLALKKPLCTAKTCRPFGLGLGLGCGGFGTYPACGPCPYASCIPKCLKHKVNLALCS